MRDPSSIILVQYCDKFMHSILLYMHHRLVIKYKGGGVKAGKIHFTKDLFFKWDLHFSRKIGRAMNYSAKI